MMIVKESINMKVKMTIDGCLAADWMASLLQLSDFSISLINSEIVKNTGILKSTGLYTNENSVGTFIIRKSVYSSS